MAQKLRNSQKLLTADTKEEKCWFNMYCTACTMAFNDNDKP